MTAQFTTTSDVYQPLELRLPEIEYVITGGVGSCFRYSIEECDRALEILLALLDSLPAVNDPLLDGFGIHLGRWDVPRAKVEARDQPGDVYGVGEGSQ